MQPVSTSEKENTAAEAALEAELRAIDSRHFRKVLGNFPTGVVAITSREASDEPIAMIVGSFTSVSLKPPLVSFLADISSYTQARIRAAGRFCANVLASDQEKLCRQMAKSGGKKFDGIRWTESPSGNPVLEGVIAWIDCRVSSVIELGDHYLIVGHVEELHVMSDKTPLVFLRGGFGDFTSDALQTLGRLLDWQ